MVSSGPDLLAVRREGSVLRVSARVPEALPWFEGHFPGRPVLPGFVQLDWALALAREHLGVSAPPAAIEALKFRSLLLPDAKFALHLEAREPGLRFDLAAPEGEIASGRLRLDASLGEHGPEARAPDAGDALPLRIPQQGPMRLIERVTSHAAGVTLCEASIRETTPLCRGGRVPAWLSLELLAQAMAAQGGLAAVDGAPASRAFLVGARRIALRTRGFEVGERLWVRVQHLRGETGFVVSECALGTGDPPPDTAAARAAALAWGPLTAYVEAVASDSATR